MTHPFPFILDYVFPIVLLLIAVIRILIAATSKIPLHKPPTESQIKESDFLRYNMVTLAFFTITVITLALTLAKPNEPNFDNLTFGYGLGYLSLAMFSFFIGPYLLSLNRYKRPEEDHTKHTLEQLTFTYIGETLEFVGIVALGTGLFYIVSLVVTNNMGLQVLYLLFLFALVGVAFFELYKNKEWYHPRKDKQRQSNGHLDNWF